MSLAHSRTRASSLQPPASNLEPQAPLIPDSDARPRIRTGTRRFLRATDAASMPEYAVLLLAVVAIALLAFDSLGNRMGGMYDRIGTGLGGAEGARVQPLGARGPDESIARLADEALLWMPSRAVLLAATALLATCAWFFLRGKAKRKAKARPALEKPGDAAEFPGVFEKRQQILKRLSNDVQALFEGKLEVRHVMTRNPITIRTSQTIQTASELMEDNGFEHLLVCDDDGRLRGLLSKHYLRRCNAQSIGEAMAVSPLVVEPQALLNPTVTRMINHGVSCVAVVEEEKPVGILTTTDVQLTFQCALQFLFKMTSDGEGDHEEAGGLRPLSDVATRDRVYAVNRMLCERDVSVEPISP